MTSVFKSNQENVLESQAMQAYARACLLIGWKMALQSPPMTYAFPQYGDHFNERLHDLNFGSRPPAHPDVTVDYAVFPALQHGEKPMNRAKVMLAEQAKTQKSDTKPTGNSTQF